MFNLNSVFKTKPKEVKVMASGNFLDTLNHIDNIRVSKEREQAQIKVRNFPEEKVKAPPQRKDEIPSLKQLKVIASGSFLDSLNHIDNIRTTKVKERDQSREEVSKTNFQEAMGIINQLRINKNFDLNKLKIASNKLIASIEHNKKNAEAYINLALIFYVLKNIRSSVRYFKIARELDPGLPEVQRLQKLISS